jgi:hypothetical protein
MGKEHSDYFVEKYKKKFPFEKQRILQMILVSLRL